MGLFRLLREWREESDGTLTGPAISTDDQTVNNSLTDPSGKTWTGQIGVWEQDGNSPTTFSGSDSYTYILDGTYDLVEIHISDLGSSGGNDLLKVQFNGDTGSNYDYRAVDGNETTGASSVIIKNFDGGAIAGGLILDLDGRWPDRCGFSSDARDTDGRVMTAGYNGNVASPLDQFTLFTQNGATLDATVEVLGRDVA